MKKTLQRWPQALPILAMSILLGACASVPSQAPHTPVAGAPAMTAGHAVAAPHAANPTVVQPAPDAWDRLRSSFAMPGCDADPAVLVWAKRYTRDPKIFERQLRDVLPQLTYVQQVAAQYDVAGEFVLLPWVESHFRPLPGHRNRPAGMWQIMPATAASMGLRIDGRYDGRLDTPATANAVMKLLKQYHDQFHDWRVVDYAYNTGAFSVGRIVRKHGMPADEPAIPRWPVRKVAREHLTKLLAVACVVREPDRFGVSLPRLPSEQRLVQVKISRSMPIARAAGRADMSVRSLKNLNAAFRSDTIDANAAPYLLLPAEHVQQFRDALPDEPDNMGPSATP